MVALLSGRKKVEVDLPDRVRVLESAEAPPLADPAGEIGRAMDGPIDSPSLAELAQGKKTACVVISDFTRPVPNAIVLPPILERLEAAGIAREGITILIATGMHRPNLGRELIDLVGRHIADNYRVINHYCRREETYRQVGEIDGAPIEICTAYLDAELKILTGLIEPHLFAGYSGGRKAILPGISSYTTMKFMHSFKMIDHPLVKNCVLEGNPFHQAGQKVTELVGADFIVNVAINRDRRLAGVWAGHWNSAHLAGCAEVKKHATISLPAAVDLVITSGGGYPLDATFYQICKGLTIARDMIKPGGSILLTAGCREGLGNAEFCEIMMAGHGPAGFRQNFCAPEDFIIDQWGAQSIYQAVEKAGEVYIHSPGLTDEQITTMGMIPVHDFQATADSLLAKCPTAVAVPDGPYVVGLVDEE